MTKDGEEKLQTYEYDFKLFTQEKMHFFKSLRSYL